MLTKEHLKFRVRSGKLSPIFIDARDAALLKQADDLIALFRSSEGVRVGELEETADALATGPVGAALTKLLFDGCDEEEDDGAAMELRSAHSGWWTAASFVPERGIVTEPAGQDIGPTPEGL